MKKTQETIAGKLMRAYASIVYGYEEGVSKGLAKEVSHLWFNTKIVKPEDEKALHAFAIEVNRYLKQKGIKEGIKLRQVHGMWMDPRKVNGSWTWSRGVCWAYQVVKKATKVKVKKKHPKHRNVQYQFTQPGWELFNRILAAEARRFLNEN